MEQKTISLDIQNSHLGKMYNDLGEHWNEKGKERAVEMVPIGPHRLLLLPGRSYYVPTIYYSPPTGRALGLRIRGPFVSAPGEA